MVARNLTAVDFFGLGKKMSTNLGRLKLIDNIKLFAAGGISRTLCMCVCDWR